MKGQLGRKRRRRKEKRTDLISISRRVAMFLTCTGADPAWASDLATGRRVRVEKDMEKGKGRGEGRVVVEERARATAR